MIDEPRHTGTMTDRTQPTNWPRRAARLQRAIEARAPLEDTIFPIPLRDGKITVRIQGLPHDLTRAEADKISAVVLAYVHVQEGANV